MGCAVVNVAGDLTASAICSESQGLHNAQTRSDSPPLKAIEFFKALGIIQAKIRESESVSRMTKVEKLKRVRL